MIVYLDTSFLVTLLTNEARSRDARRWIDTHADAELAGSDWVAAEFAAALSMKRRLNAVTVDEHAASTAEFARLRDQSFIWFDVEKRHFSAVADLSERTDVGLRAGDALHLAVASSHGASVLTLDLGMAQAARDLGIEVEAL